MKKIVRLVEPVNMGLSHDGLALFCKKILKINIEELSENDLLLFVNRARDRLKVLGAKGQVIGYLRLADGQRLHMDALRYIPQTFGASGFSYDEALKKSLRTALETVE